MNDTMADRILRRVIEYDWVTFAEIARIEGAAAPPGEGFAIMFTKGKSERFLWANLTKDACDAFAALMNEQKIAIAPSSLITYLIDGKGYDDKNWVPVTLRPACKANDVVGRWLYHDPERKRPSAALKALLADA
jgi:hypothetical protein